MRLLDLLDSIDLTTRHYRPEIREAGRLGLMKAAFPRPDLLSWFDAQPFAEVAPRDYFSLLACAFLWHSQPKIDYRRLVLCGGPDSLAVRHAPGFVLNSPKHVWTLGQDGGIPADAEMPPMHEVGVVIGTFDRGAEIAALLQCLESNFYHATRLFILSDEALAALSGHAAIERPIGGPHSAFEGPFLRWGTQRSHAIYILAVAAE